MYLGNCLHETLFSKMSWKSVVLSCKGHPLSSDIIKKALKKPLISIDLGLLHVKFNKKKITQQEKTFYT